MQVLGILLLGFSFLAIIKGQINFGDQGRAINNPGSNINQPQVPPQQGNNNNQDIEFDNPRPASSPSCTTPDGRRGSCLPLSSCALFFAEIPTLLDNPCETGDGQGICCPDNAGGQRKGPRPSSTIGDTGLLRSITPRVAIPNITPQQLNKNVDSGLKNFREREQKVNKILFQDRITIAKGSPSEGHQRLLSTNDENLNNGQNAQINLEVTKNLVNDLKFTKEQSVFGLPKSLINTRATQIPNSCPPTSQCRPSFPYRTMDGSCNNRKNLDWGKAGSQFQRILQPDYSDGVNSPRVAESGRPLPSTRLISGTTVPDINRPYNNLTLMVMQFGQFIDHDITHTPIVQGSNRTSISCCSTNGQHLSPNLRHPDCFQIDIPSNDRFYSRFRQRCMEFVRSLPAQRRECNFGPREQMNQITSFLDASHVYGSDNTKARSLREFSGGRLIVQRNNLGGGSMLPANPTECSSPQTRRSCFRSGDLRTNEQINLAVLHTIFMREHNRIAGELQRLNPHWNDEVLYQEARRILGAEMQHITYNEFLPLILGPDYMRTYSLHPSAQGKTNLYDENIDPTITNAFAAAAFRFGHTLVPGIFESFNQFGGVIDRMEFQKTQFSPFKIYDSFDPFVRGLVSQQSQQFDNFVTEALTNHLFEGTSNFGLDLIALNIQRGRDHGIPAYLKWREICGLKPVTGWNDLDDVIGQRNAQMLRNLYERVEDIDLFIGGIMERPLDRALLGPTFVCIVGDQFARLRRGDRFFYEEQTARFTDAQLGQLRRVSLARILCDNSNQMSVIQPLVMQQASLLNRRMDCKSNNIPRIDLRFWRESRRGNNQRG